MTSINTREVTKAYDDPADEFLHDGEKKVAVEDKAFVKEDDADGTEKTVRQCSPIKSRWIVPLLLKEIMEQPNMSDTEMKHLVSAYVKDKFITNALLHNARTMERDKIFGDPATNVLFANGLFQKMKELGVDVKVIMKDWQEVLQMLERVVL